MTRRTLRVNVLLREELSHLITNELKDPRIDGLVTITEVQTSPDLRHAKVFVSVFGEHGNKNDTVEGLTTAEGFLRRLLKTRLSLQRIPELSFIQDNSLEYGTRIANLIQKTVHRNEDPLGN